jgi:hypothetical protein
LYLWEKEGNGPQAALRAGSKLTNAREASNPASQRSLPSTSSLASKAQPGQPNILTKSTVDSLSQHLMMASEVQAYDTQRCPMPSGEEEPGIWSADLLCVYSQFWLISIGLETHQRVLLRNKLPHLLSATSMFGCKRTTAQVPGAAPVSLMFSTVVPQFRMRLYPNKSTLTFLHP